MWRAHVKSTIMISPVLQGQYDHVSQTSLLVGIEAKGRKHEKQKINTSQEKLQNFNAVVGKSFFWGTSTFKGVDMLRQ